MEEHLLHELGKILEACDRRDVTVFVIGAFSVRAYGSLLRRTLDLDLAVRREDWPALAEVLKTQGYSLESVGIWATARKGEGEDALEIHIALGDVTDVHSALSYPVSVEPGTRQPVPDLSITLPVFTLEGLLITKLIALRDNDVVDIVTLLAQHADRLAAGRFWERAVAAGLEDALENRLDELDEMLESGEVEVIWWDRLGLMLDERERQVALDAVRGLQKYGSEYGT
jgi:hypothetical protein